MKEEKITITNAQELRQEKCNVPTLRFKRYTTEWTKINLSNYLFVSSKRNKDGRFSKEDVLSVSGELGIVNQIALLGRSYAGESVLPYHIVEKGDIVYTKSPLALYPYGIIKTNRNKVGIVSTLYAVYKTKDNANNRFIEHYFSLKSRINNYLKPIVRIGAKHDMKIGNNEVLENIVAFPDISEQCEIADFLDLLDNRISVQNKIISDLKVLKKELCNKVFSKGSAVRLGVFIEEVTTRNKSNSCENVLSVSNKMGFIKQSEQFEDRTVASENKSNYKVVTEGCFAYNPARINVGSIALLSTYKIGIISPMYVCFKAKSALDSEYLNFYYQSGFFYKELQKKLEGSVRQCLTYENMSEILIPYVGIEKQKAIATALNKFATLIANEEKYLKSLQKQKSYFLSAMFI